NVFSPRISLQIPTTILLCEQGMLLNKLRSNLRCEINICMVDVLHNQLLEQRDLVYNIPTRSHLIHLECRQADACYLDFRAEQFTITRILRIEILNIIQN